MILSQEQLAILGDVILYPQAWADHAVATVSEDAVIARIEGARAGYEAAIAELGSNYKSRLAREPQGNFQVPLFDGTQWVEGQDPAVMLAQTNANIISSLTAAVQKHLDDTAKMRGYDGILSACTYATDTHPPFKAEGQACVDWRGAVWGACYTIMAAVQAGNHAMPTEASLIAELPVMVWP